jgi:hypothetical protein
MKLRQPARRFCRGALILTASVSLWNCGGGGSTPSPGSGTSPGTGTTPGAGPGPGTGTTPDPVATRITGSERLVWTQPGDASNLRFRAYVDENPVDLGSVSCASSRQPDCSSPLPPMSDGVHTITLVAVATPGGESPRSDSLLVEKISATGAIGAASLPNATTEAAVRVETIITSPDGQAFAVDAVARSLKAPLQLAPLPDGRLLVADGDGRVSVMHPGEPQRDGVALDARDFLDEASAGAPGLAVHPDFARNHLVYASLVLPTSAGTRLRIVRLREVGGSLGEPATMFEAPLIAEAATSGKLDVRGSGQRPDPAAASARLTFGPDRLLYALLSPGIEFDHEPAASRPLASIIRLDDEGRVASAGALAGIAAHPLGLAWHPATNELLAIFPAANGTASIASVQRGAVSGVTATAEVAADPGGGGSGSPGLLRFDSADTRAWPLGRAFVEQLGTPGTAAVRLTAPVALDGLLGSLSGELIDVVASGGTVYAAVAASATPGGGDARSGIVIRLRPR